MPQLLASITPYAPSPSLKQSEAFCRRYSRSRRENFVVASCLLPKRIRQHFYNIYTYCRMADDIADELASADESLRQLDLWQQQLDLCYSGQPSHVAFVALQSTIETYQIPQAPFANLLVAFRRDQSQGRYATLDDLIDYCSYSANPVGHLILHLGECFDDSRAFLSDQICTGLQLANHLQDVACDFQRGRIYLPQEACQKHGVDSAMLSESQASPQLKSLLREYVEITEGYFDRGLPLLQDVPHWLKIDLQLFVDGGRAALSAIRHADFDVLAKRCKVSKASQVKMLIGTACRQWFTR